MTNVLHKTDTAIKISDFFFFFFCYLLYYAVHCYISQMLLWYSQVQIILHIIENVCNFSCFPGNNCKCTNSLDCSTPPAADVSHRRGTCATQLHTCQTRRTLCLITHILVPQRPFIWWSEGSVNLVSYQDTGGRKIFTQLCFGFNQQREWGGWKSNHLARAEATYSSLKKTGLEQFLLMLIISDNWVLLNAKICSNSILCHMHASRVQHE